MEGFVVTWWMWFILGVVLLLAELTTPGAFYQLFFGLGAIVVGLIGLVGIELPLAIQMLLSSCCRSGACCCCASACG